MTRLLLASLLFAAACGDNAEPASNPDAGSTPADAAPDAGAADASFDAAPADGGDADAGFDAGVDAGPVTDDPTGGRWQPGFALPGPSGMGSRVEKIVRAEDGTVYVGGIFREVAGVPARNVARWTGTAWEALGDGLPGWVMAMAVDRQGRLWAAGRLTDTAGVPNRLARWDGDAWTFFDGGIDGAVEDIAVLDGDQVVVVGGFTHAGSIESPSVARFDGTWHAVGKTGAEGASAVIATGGDDFCVAGDIFQIGSLEIENAACWNGKAWSPLGAGLPGGADTIVRGPDQRLYVGGRLTFQHVPDFGEFRHGIAVLDGDIWLPFEGGVDSGFVTEVRAIAWVGDDMYVGGDFHVAGHDAPVAAHHIARHDATGWHTLGEGLRNDIGVYLGSLLGVNDFLVDPSGLWLGGIFSSADGVAATNLARLDAAGRPAPVLPAGAAPRGLAGIAECITLDAEGRVVVGGHFAAAGTTPARNVARLGDAGWEPLGAGFNDAVLTLLVRRDGTLVAGGNFTRSGTATLPFLAAWSGTSWVALGEAPDGPVRALAEDSTGTLYAAGAFTRIGGVAADHVARWDGDEWKPLAAGLDDDVAALVWTGTELVAGGGFDASGTTPAIGLARWSGTAWSSVGTGLASDSDRVSALASSPSGLIVAGELEVVPTGSENVADLARWDGATWHAFGDGVSDEIGFSMVTTVLPFGDGLFAGGTFDRSGDTSVRYLGWWDGAAWHGLGGGLDDMPTGLAVRGRTLWVAGTAIEVGGRVSSGIAAWDFSAR